MALPCFLVDVIRRYVAASSVKRPESAAVDRYVHGKLLPAYATHIQATCSKPPAVPSGSLPLLFLDFGPHLHVGLFPALVRTARPCFKKDHALEMRARLDRRRGAPF
jgi:hypothetical protein